MKNIPTPLRQRYLRNMMERVEGFISRLRWKTHFFDKGMSREQYKLWF